MSGGKGNAASDSGTSMVNASRSPMRICRIEWYARTSSTSWPTVETDSRILGRALRRYWIKWPVISLARAGSTSVSAWTLASKIRRDVTGDMYRIGIGAALILLLVPLFLVAVVIKFFVDRSRASQTVAEVKRKEADYARMAQQVTEAKLAALQAQVKPHFLYNTLASVL